MNKKEAKIAQNIVKVSSDGLDLAHRALTNTLAFLERSPIQGIKSIELLQEAFAFVYQLREQVEKDIAKSKQSAEATTELEKDAAVEEVAKQA